MIPDIEYITPQNFGLNFQKNSWSFEKPYQTIKSLSVQFPISETIKGTCTSFRRNDFWDRLGGKHCLWLVNGYLEYHRPIITNACPPKSPGEGGGHSAYRIWKVGMLVGNFEFNPWTRPSRLNMMTFCPEHPKWDQNPKFIPLSETTSIPTPFICGVPPLGPNDPRNHCTQSFFYLVSLEFLKVGIT